MIQSIIFITLFFTRHCPFTLPFVSSAEVNNHQAVIVLIKTRRLTPIEPLLHLFHQNKTETFRLQKKSFTVPLQAARRTKLNQKGQIIKTLICRERLRQKLTIHPRRRPCVLHRKPDHSCLCPPIPRRSPQREVNLRRPGRYDSRSISA